MSEEKINHAPEDAAAAAEAELNAKLAKPSLMDIFVRGARKGWNIAIDNIIPNVLMAYVCIKILNVTGLLTLAGKFFAPVMAIWGLPGEAIMVLFSALMSMGGAVGVCMALYNDGGIDERSITIVYPRYLPLGFQDPISGPFAGYCRRSFQTLSDPAQHFFPECRYRHVHHENFDHVKQSNSFNFTVKKDTIKIVSFLFAAIFKSFFFLFF